MKSHMEADHRDGVFNVKTWIKKNMVEEFNWIYIFCNNKLKQFCLQIVLFEGKMIFGMDNFLYIKTAMDKILFRKAGTMVNSPMALMTRELGALFS